MTNYYDTDEYREQEAQEAAEWAAYEADEAMRGAEQDAWEAKQIDAQYHAYRFGGPRYAVRCEHSSERDDGSECIWIGESRHHTLKEALFIAIYDQTHGTVVDLHAEGDEVEIASYAYGVRQ